jgi:hypothetical protein
LRFFVEVSRSLKTLRAKLCAEEKAVLHGFNLVIQLREKGRKWFLKATTQTGRNAMSVLNRPLTTSTNARPSQAWVRSLEKKKKGKYFDFGSDSYLRYKTQCSR